MNQFYKIFLYILIVIKISYFISEFRLRKEKKEKANNEIIKKYENRTFILLTTSELGMYIILILLFFPRMWESRKFDRVVVVSREEEIMLTVLGVLGILHLGWKHYFSLLET